MKISEKQYNFEAAERLRCLEFWATCEELRIVLLQLYCFALELEKYHELDHLQQKDFANFLKTMLIFLEGVGVWLEAEPSVEEG